MADRDIDTLLDPLVQVAELQQRLRELDSEEGELRERLAETRRRLAGQRAGSGPSAGGAAPWKWAVCMYVVGFIMSLLSQHLAR